MAFSEFPMTKSQNLQISHYFKKKKNNIFKPFGILCCTVLLVCRAHNKCILQVNMYLLTYQFFKLVIWLLWKQ